MWNALALPAFALEQIHILETPKGLHYTYTPSCPKCRRQSINDWDVKRILGRPPPPKRLRPHQIEVPPSPPRGPSLYRFEEIL